MNVIYDNMEFWDRLLDLLQNQFGESTEIVLHEHVKNDYNHSIVDIRNGQITGRKIGGCGSNLGLEVFRGTVKDKDRYNYISTTKDGKILRSSTMFLEDADGTITGSLCINTDITETLHMEDYLRKHNNIANVPSDSAIDSLIARSEAHDSEKDTSLYSEQSVEFFAQDVSQVLDYLIEAAQERIGKPVNAMRRAEKIEFIRFLDSRGAFLITKSSERVYEYLDISRYTFYNYLDQVHADASKKNANSSSFIPPAGTLQDT